jgi:hypothetical protein
MVEMHNEKQKKNTVQPLTAGLAVGAALGAAAVVLSNKKNQEKVKHAFKKAQKWANEKTEQIKARSEDAVEEAKEITMDMDDSDDKSKSTQHHGHTGVN